MLHLHDCCSSRFSARPSPMLLGGCWDSFFVDERVVQKIIFFRCAHQTENEKSSVELPLSLARDLSHVKELESIQVHTIFALVVENSAEERRGEENRGEMNLLRKDWL
eukprot:scaffold3552_cov140-Skeletonema_marinoi.AAC.8